MKQLLRKIYNFSVKNGLKVYLVGGYLRDLLIKRNNRDKKEWDLDFAIEKNAIKFGKKLASELKAGFVVLDKEHGCCRLVKRAKEKLFTLDFTDFRGKDIVEDLFHRDFTINALAIDLKDFLKNKDKENFFIDPFGAKNDLKNKILRLVNRDSFLEDPLRILRLFSFSAILGFRIDKKMIFLIRRQRKLIAQVSAERIRDELFKILDLDNSYPYIEMMDNLKILELIIPQINRMRRVYQGPYHHLDVFSHSLETLKQLEKLMAEYKNNLDLASYLEELLAANRKRRSLIKLAAFLHDIGKPQAKFWQGGKVKFHGHERIGQRLCEEIGRHLKLSNTEIEMLKTTVLWHLRPGYLAGLDTLTARAKFRFFRDAGKEAVSVLLVSLADQRSTRGPLTTKESRKRHKRIVKSLINEYFKKQKEKPMKRLINGDDLINIFKLEPSPLFGKILKKIDELQAIGKINTKKDALKWVEVFLRHNKI